MPIPGLSLTDEQLFTSLNAALPAWLLLLLAPRWRGTLPVVTLTAAAFAAMYTLVTVQSILQGSEAIDMFSYGGVAKLLATPSAVLPAWVHYVVFDLWTGRWEILMALPLFFTCMLGPAGLLLYLALIRPWFPVKPAGGAKQE